MPANSSLYIGLMSGTSLDGVDGVLASFPDNYQGGEVPLLATAYVPFPEELRAGLLALQGPGNDEIHREALAANALAHRYAECISQLLKQAGKAANEVRAAGVHGQTIRHRPEFGYTRQTNNPALLAELSGVDIIADLRSRDIAAGGQGAPLVPAFHRAVFSSADEARVVANIGGIANVSVLPAWNTKDAKPIIGFDTGPGNVLMDAWIARHAGKAYDDNGAWAASGTVSSALLNVLCEEPYLTLPPPKSTGRDLFHMDWLQNKLAAFISLAPQDVQATLAAFTATTLADAIAAHASATQAVFVCGGGAHNTHLIDTLRDALHDRKVHASVDSTAALGISPNHVEAMAFAWLAHRFDQRLPGNLPSVTGAVGDRVLGALYPA